MNEESMMFIPDEEIFNNLKKYISEKASIKTWVGRNKVDNQNPMIVFEESRNEIYSRSTTYNNITRVLNYNINIYCKNLPNNYEIVQELTILVCELMQNFYKMSGGLIGKFPTFDITDKTSYQANLRFTTHYIPKGLKLY